MKIGGRAAAIAVLVCGPVFGQTGGSRVTEILRRGVQLRQDGWDEAALVEFRRALQLSPEPRVHAQLALAEQALGLWVEAARHLEAALAGTTDPWIQRNRHTLEASRDDIDQHVGRLLVTGGVTGAEVLLNGERIATLPMSEVPVLAGSGELEVRASGFVSVTRSLRIEAGARARERVVLSAIASAPSPPAVRAIAIREPSESASSPALVSTYDSSEERPSQIRRVVIDVGVGLGAAFLSGRPSYAEQRIFTRSDRTQVRSCSGYVCYATIDPGFHPTYFLTMGVRYNFTSRIGLAIVGRLQFDTASWSIDPTPTEAAMGGTARSNPFANLLLMGRLYYAFTGHGFATTGFVASIFVGGGVGQIEPKPRIPDNVAGEGAHVLSGYGNGHAGLRLEWTPARHFHIGAEIIMQFMFPTFLFDLDTTIVTGVHF